MGSARILVIDHDAGARDLLVRALNDRGYRAATCEPADAPHAARSFRPDLVVLEMVHPGGFAGEDLALGLHAGSDPLLVFVSSESSVKSRLAAFDVGADDYVTKPYDLDELVARLRAVLRRTGRLGSAVSHVGRLVVDERAHTVTFADTPRELGPTDFALLAVLARHAGQVMGKSKLLRLVWGYDAYNENLVVVRVSILRRRLGPDAAELVHTVRGVGYVLRDDGFDDGPWRGSGGSGFTQP
jgi:DNA-binding response OmpR family regulator